MAFALGEKGRIKMYSLVSLSLLHRTPTAQALTPADVLDILKRLDVPDEPYFKDVDSFRPRKYGDVPVITTYWGAWRDKQECIEELKNIGAAQYYQAWEGETNGVYRYIWEGIIMYEDGRPVLAFDSPYKGRG